MAVWWATIGGIVALKQCPGEPLVVKWPGVPLVAELGGGPLVAQWRGGTVA